MYSHFDDERDPYENDRDMDEHSDTVACKRCGENGLSWVNMGAQHWRLMDEDCTLHYCKPTADDFTDIS